MKRISDSMSSTQDKLAPLYAQTGGELLLSNRGQLELLRGMMQRQVPLRIRVRGFSMLPFIRDKDVLTIAPMNGLAPRVGEVIAIIVPNRGRLAIHRVITREGEGWRVSGDNSAKTDGVVTLENIVGRVVRIERRGNEVRLGLGLERRWIAALNRGGHLMRLRKLWCVPRVAYGFALRLAQTLPLYRAFYQKDKKSARGTR